MDYLLMGLSCGRVPVFVKSEYPNLEILYMNFNIFS